MNSYMDLPKVIYGLLTLALGMAYFPCRISFQGLMGKLTLPAGRRDFLKSTISVKLDGQVHRLE